MSNIRGYVVAGITVLTVVFALSTYQDIIHGNLKAGLIPSWIDFAIAHPTLFAFILVVGGRAVRRVVHCGDEQCRTIHANGRSAGKAASEISITAKAN